MVRGSIVLASILLAILPMEADACTLVAPPIEETVNRIAAGGVLIRGTLIQAFDASKQQPEIIRADAIFVGDGDPRDFVIYRTFRTFPQARDRTTVRTACPDGPPPYKVGRVFERLVLEPANPSIDAAANGRWIFSMFGGQAARGKALDLLIGEAVRVGRFKERPPHDAAWDN